MPSFYRDKWSRLKTATIDPDEFRQLSRQVANSFMDAYLKDCHYESDYIDLLCEMTTVPEERALNGVAARSLFTIIIERLCDDFEELQTETYNRVMSQIISFCRRLPAGNAFDRCLQDFGIQSQEDLLERIKDIRRDGKMLSAQRNVKKILFLSRVTIGADVAITSIIIQRMARRFPDAELVLIGGKKLEEIYSGNQKVRLRHVEYDRNGGLLERLASWQLVLRIVQEELRSCPLENTILIDPDSRLSQLGVLPIIHPDHYFFFDSRSDFSFDSNMSMAELTNSWLNHLAGPDDFHQPKVWLLPAILQTAARCRNRLKSKGARRLIVVNFGVGGNRRKQVGRRFEQNLLLSLLQVPDTVIILDKGVGDDELQASNALLTAVRESGYSVHDTSFAASIETDIRWGVVGLQTGIGEIAAMIAAADEYIGYDSACQHIAAALGTPCLTVFAGSNNMRFIRRWSAYGPGSCQIVHVDTLTDPNSIDVEDIIIRVMNMRRVRGT